MVIMSQVCYYYCIFFMLVSFLQVSLNRKTLGEKRFARFVGKILILTYHVLSFKFPKVSPDARITFV